MLCGLPNPYAYENGTSRVCGKVLDVLKYLKFIALEPIYSTL